MSHGTDAYLTAAGDIALNAGRPTVVLTVANSGDRAIQVGSHFHFFEVNRALRFDRAAAFGMRLDIPAGTAVRFEPGETKDVTLVTLGGIDTHIRMIAPQQVYDALSNGITTMIGGGTGPADGTRATTCTPDPWQIARMLAAAESLPVNWGLLGKGNASAAAPLEEQVLAGVCGLKLHEDWGTTPRRSTPA